MEAIECRLPLLSCVLSTLAKGLYLAVGEGMVDRSALLFSDQRCCKTTIRGGIRGWTPELRPSYAEGWLGKGLSDDWRRSNTSHVTAGDVEQGDGLLLSYLLRIELRVLGLELRYWELEASMHGIR